MTNEKKIRIGEFLGLVLLLLLFLLLPDSFPVSGHLRQGMFIAPIGYSSRIATQALGLILISWIMKMGHDIQEEQKHTV